MPVLALLLALLAPLRSAAQDDTAQDDAAQDDAAPVQAEAPAADHGTTEPTSASAPPSAAVAPVPEPPSAAPAEPALSPEPPIVVPSPSDTGSYWFTLSIGFSHWFGGTFGAPPGSSTPGLTLGAVLLDWLELQLAYSISVVELQMPDESQSHVGFLTLALLVRHELAIARERLMIGCGILGGIVHTENGVREALGTAIVARYLVRVADGVSLGPFVDARLVQYELPESSLPLFEVRDGALVTGHSDLDIQIGVALAF